MLAFSSLASYVGLGFGFLGNTLALPFGLYVLIFQREAEKYLQDEVSDVNDTRKYVAAAIFVFALLVLAPNLSAAGNSAVDIGNLPSNFI